MILSNQVECLNCGEKPWSAHRHDFVQCGCLVSEDKICVDGGMDYLRRVAGKNANFTDMSITLDDEHVEGLKDILEDTKNNWNSLGRLCAIARYLRDELDINLTQGEEG